MRKINLLPVAAIILTIFVIYMSISSDLYWKERVVKAAEEDLLRKVIALPSVAAGANYRATRNPLLELYCAALYDMPGGYDYIVATSLIGCPLWDPYIFQSIPGFNYTARRG